MKDELRELLAEKLLKLLEALEDFESTYMRGNPRAKQLAEELLDILNKIEFMNKHE